MDLQGRTVLITGVSKGIGKALCQQYLEEGSVVAGMGRNRPDIDHPRFHFYQTDVRSNEEVKASFAKMRSELGEELHILINNAGLGRFGPVEDVDTRELHQMFETNVYSIFYTTAEAVPQMKKQQYGHIINIASTAGLEAYPQASAYCGTKFAVKAISGSMYKELRDHRIKVTCVYPGSVRTHFFDEHPYIDAHEYMLDPDDVAAMMVQATKTPDNFHQVNLEVRPLQPKGPRKN